MNGTQAWLCIGMVAAALWTSGPTRAADSWNYPIKNIELEALPVPPEWADRLAEFQKRNQVGIWVSFGETMLFDWEDGTRIAAVGLAPAYWQMEQWQDALTYMRFSLDSVKVDRTNLISLPELEYLQGNFVDASRALDKCVEVLGKTAERSALGALIAVRCDQKARAVDLCQEAVKLRNGSRADLLEVLLALDLLDAAEKELEAWRREVQTPEEKLLVAACSGDLARAQGRREEMVKHYLLALELNDGVTGQCMLFDALSSSFSIASEANAFWFEFLLAHPKHTVIAELFFRQLAASGDDTIRQEHFDKLAAELKATPGFARIVDETLQPQEAMVYYQEALQIRDSAELRFYAARNALIQGKNDEARRLLEPLLQGEHAAACCWLLLEYRQEAPEFEASPLENYPVVLPAKKFEYLSDEESIRLMRHAELMLIHDPLATRSLRLIREANGDFYGVFALLRRFGDGFATKEQRLNYTATAVWAVREFLDETNSTRYDDMFFYSSCDPERLAREVAEALKRKDPALALSWLRRFPAEVKGNVSLTLLTAIALEANGELDAALTAYAQAWRLAQALPEPPGVLIPTAASDAYEYPYWDFVSCMGLPADKTAVLLPGSRVKIQGVILAHWNRIAAVPAHREKVLASLESLAFPGWRGVLWAPERWRELLDDPPALAFLLDKHAEKVGREIDKAELERLLAWAQKCELPFQLALGRFAVQGEESRRIQHNFWGNLVYGLTLEEKFQLWGTLHPEFKKLFPAENYLIHPQVPTPNFEALSREYGFAFPQMMIDIGTEWQERFFEYWWEKYEFAATHDSSATQTKAREPLQMLLNFNQVLARNAQAPWRRIAPDDMMPRIGAECWWWVDRSVFLKPEYGLSADNGDAPRHWKRWKLLRELALIRTIPRGTPGRDEAAAKCFAALVAGKAPLLKAADAYDWAASLGLWQEAERFRPAAWTDSLWWQVWKERRAIPCLDGWWSQCFVESAFCGMGAYEESSELRPSRLRRTLPKLLANWNTLLLFGTLSARTNRENLHREFAAIAERFSPSGEELPPEIRHSFSLLNAYRNQDYERVKQLSAQNGTASKVEDLALLSARIMTDDPAAVWPDGELRFAEELLLWANGSAPEVYQKTLRWILANSEKIDKAEFCRIVDAGVFGDKKALDSVPPEAWALEALIAQGGKVGIRALELAYPTDAQREEDYEQKLLRLATTSSAEELQEVFQAYLRLHPERSEAVLKALPDSPEGVMLHECIRLWMRQESDTEVFAVDDFKMFLRERSDNPWLKLVWLKRLGEVAEWQRYWSAVSENDEARLFWYGAFLMNPNPEAGAAYLNEVKKQGDENLWFAEREKYLRNFPFEWVRFAQDNEVWPRSFVLLPHTPVEKIAALPLWRSFSPGYVRSERKSIFGELVARRTDHDAILAAVPEGVARDLYAALTTGSKAEVDQVLAKYDCAKDSPMAGYAWSLLYEVGILSHQKDSAEDLARCWTFLCEKEGVDFRGFISLHQMSDMDMLAEVLPGLLKNSKVSSFDMVTNEWGNSTIGRMRLRLLSDRLVTRNFFPHWYFEWHGDNSAEEKRESREMLTALLACEVNAPPYPYLLDIAVQLVGRMNKQPEVVRKRWEEEIFAADTFGARQIRIAMALQRKVMTPVVAEWYRRYYYEFAPNAEMRLVHAAHLWLYGDCDAYREEVAALFPLHRSGISQYDELETLVEENLRKEKNEKKSGF